MRELLIGAQGSCAFINTFTMGHYFDNLPTGLLVIGIGVFAFNIMAVVKLSMGEVVMKNVYVFFLGVGCTTLILGLSKGLYLDVVLPSAFGILCISCSLWSITYAKN